MPAYVVDASVACKWYFEEALSAKAELLLQDFYTRLAPDFIYVEVGASAWKHVRRNEVDEATAKEALAELRSLALTLTPASDLVSAALDLALQTGRSIYDCLYLALAVRSHSPLITADRKLFDAIKAGPLAEHVSWVGDERFCDSSADTFAIGVAFPNAGLPTSARTAFAKSWPSLAKQSARHPRSSKPGARTSATSR